MNSSIRVVFQATLSLGEFNDKSIIPVLVKVVNRYGYSSWFRTAVLSCEAGSSIDFLKALERENFFGELALWKLAFFESFSNVIGGRNQEIEIVSLLENILQSSIVQASDWQRTSVKGLLKGLEKSEKLDDSLKERLKSIETESRSDIGKAIRYLKQLYSKPSKK